MKAVDTLRGLAWCLTRQKGTMYSDVLKNCSAVRWCTGVWLISNEVNKQNRVLKNGFIRSRGLN